MTKTKWGALSAMFIHPSINPIALQVGPVKIYWYGLMYLLSFVVFFGLCHYRRRLPHNHWVTAEMIDNFVLYGVIGVVGGGRLGEVILYHPFYYWHNPAEIIKVWHGGMSFHGGLAGVILSILFMCHRKKINFINVMDFSAPLVVPGYIFGRIGNFINSELIGRPSSVPWAVVFPRVDSIPRHPSQLYQASVDGLLLFIIMWLYTKKERPRCAVSGAFLTLYAITRSFTELFKIPDGSMHIFSFEITIGQYYCIPLFFSGIGMLLYGYRDVLFKKNI